MLKENDIIDNLFGFINKDFNLNDYPETDVITIFINKESVEAKKFQFAELLEGYLESSSKPWEYNKFNVFTVNIKNNIKRFLVVGTERKGETINDLRKLAGSVSEKLINLKFKNSVIIYEDFVFSNNIPESKAVFEGLLLGLYKFDRYKPEKKDFSHITLFAKNNKLKNIYQESKIICNNVFWARDLVNEPGNVVTPRVLAYESEKITDKVDLECEILDEDAMKKLGMNSLLSVGKGSNEESQLITLTYTGSNPSNPYIAFVGKGVTFDSGGISIKPSQDMGEMKDDMTGAAVVLGAVKTIAELKLPINIIGIAGCAENMPSSKAMRPGDIVKAANGKTIEVINTDAEGRMVLADAVWYACEKKASKVIDIATLTGAVIIALGTETAGIISNNEKLTTQIKEAGNTVGERYWELPNLPEFKEMIKGEITDVINSTGRPGGVITGGLFVGEFIKENTLWAHIDIGGTATASKTKGHIKKGATAFGLTTLVEFAKMEISNNEKS